MLVLRGKQQIGVFQGKQVKVDWDDLFYYRGNLGKIHELEMFFGKLLMGAGAIAALVGMILPLLSGATFNFYAWFNGPHLIFIYVGVLSCIYGSYLGRDKRKFAFGLEYTRIEHISKLAAGSIELENYFSYEIWSYLDQIYHDSPEDFLAIFVNKLHRAAGVKLLCSRLGLDAADQTKLEEFARVQINGRFDQHIGLYLATLYKAVEIELPEINEVAFWLVFAQTIWKEELLKLFITKQEIDALQIWVRDRNRQYYYYKLWDQQRIFKPKGSVNRAYTSRYAPTVETYGEDYTLFASAGDFRLATGKNEEITQIIKVLQKGSNAAAMLIGDPGVGKSRFLKHLAVRMVVEDVPVKLKDKRLIAFDFNKAFTQSQNFETFKVILQNVLQEAGRAGNIVLVLDNIDQLLNVREQLQAEIVSLLVAGLDKHQLQLVATCTQEGYQRLVKPHRELAAQFSPVYLTEPQGAIALQILLDEVQSLERKYEVQVAIPAVRQIVEFAPKFNDDKVMPAKGIALLEEAVIEARDQGLNFVGEQQVNSLISRKVGVSVGRISQDEAGVLVALEEKMHQRVVGQQEAIRAVAMALRRSRAGLKTGKKPVASFLFFGPTGVGKTEVARTLAATYYGDENLITRIDMSEYQEEDNLGRLIGYEERGNFVGGYLTEAVRKRPFSLILFDEIEKANPKVLDLFLQILDEGHLTDGVGRKINFENTIIICTSNAASADIADLLLNHKTYNEVYQEVQPALRKVFRVELLNRFDKVIMFRPLHKLEVAEIVERMLDKVNSQLMEKGYRFEYTDAVATELVDLAYNPIYGAREIRRVIQEQIEDQIAEAIVVGKLQPGGNLIINELRSHNDQA